MNSSQETKRIEGVSHPHQLIGELAGEFREATSSEVGPIPLQTSLNASDHRQPPLSILLATNHLIGWTGSETLLLTLAQGLIEHGCKLTVYTRHWNQDWLDGHFDHRIKLTNDLNTIQKQHFDLAHIQHSSCLVDIKTKFPRLPIIFSSLGVLPFLEQPPPFYLGISTYLAISEEVANNLVRQGVPRHSIHIVRNMVNGEKFSPKDTIRKQPERILVLSYKIDEERKLLLRKAAKHIGASINFIGGSGHIIPQDRIRDVINEADVVVTLGRGVVESMLCGRVPLVFDIHGGDGLVTPDSLGDLWECNFSGRHYASKYTVNDLVGELKKYHQEYGQQLRELALESFGAEENIPHLLDLYNETLALNAHTDIPQSMSEILDFLYTMTREDARFAHYSGAKSKAARIERTAFWRLTSPLHILWNSLRKLIKG